MKKLLAALLAAMIILSCLTAMADAGSEPDWSEYDKLIADIKTERDLAVREDMLHHAEALLMDTGAVLPLYYDNSAILQRGTVSGVYNDPFGITYFKKAAVEGSDTLRVNLFGEPETMDPALCVAMDGAILANACFGGLYARNAQGKPEPNYATGCEISADGLTYTFSMREGLKWSDGTPLDAHDFEYSWKRAADPLTGAGYSYMFNGIKGYPKNLAVAASADGSTLTVELSAPCAYFLDLMGFVATFAVPRAAVESAPNAKLSPGSWTHQAGFVCSGPFVVSQWKNDEYLELSKNPNYWDADNVKQEKILFMLSTDATAVYTAYMAGNLDLISNIPRDEVLPLKESPEFHIFDRLGTQFICFNVKSYLFDGMTVEQAAAMRKAFAILIDRDFIVETVAQYGQKPANCYIPYTMADGRGGFFKTSDPDYAYPVVATLDSGEKAEGYFDLDVDVKGAIELLKQAGFKFDGDKLSADTPIVFEFLTLNAIAATNIGECIQQDLAAVGIEMVIRAVEFKEYVSELLSGHYDVAAGSWSSDFNDPLGMLEMWSSTSGNNFCFLGR